MRTSLNEIKLIDDHIFNRGTIGDQLVFDAMQIIDDDLPAKITRQKNTHSIIQQYSRKLLRVEIETVHQKLFNEPKHRSFRQRIISFFR